MNNQGENRLKRVPAWVYMLAVLTIVCSLVVAIAIVADQRDKANAKLEAVYEKSFYDLISDVNDIEIKLDKLSVSSSVSYQRELLDELSRRADLAATNVAQLSSSGGVLETTTKYINQLSDYAKHLCKKLDKGEALSAEEKASLKSLAEVSTQLGIKLTAIRDRISEGDLIINDASDGISFDLAEMDETSIDYPELIYDGPFADSIVNKAPEGLKGEAMTIDQGYERAKLASGGKDILPVGVWEGKIKTLNYASEDNTVLVKLAENGQLLMYSTVSEDGQGDYGAEECVNIAKSYIESNGFSGLVPVWYSNYYGNIFVNFVHEENDVIYYNDMVKVKVSSITGEVVAFEGLAYAYNHKERDVANPTISESEALTKVSADITVESIRLALVPKGEEEKLCYEVFGEANGRKYFVYVDAESGEEINILCVIDSEQGELLM